MLRQAKLERRTDARAVTIKRTVGTQACIVESDQHVRPAMKTLLIVEVCRRSAGPANWRTGKNIVRNRVVVIKLQSAGQNWIETGNKRPQSYRARNPERPSANTAGACASSTRPGSHVAAQSS